MEYEHLGVFSDLVTAAKEMAVTATQMRPGPASYLKIREVLNFGSHDEIPSNAQLERTWTADGVLGEAYSWSVGYGPRTEAWLLRPEEAGSQRLPGVLALHDHGDFKLLGKEKIADDADGPSDAVSIHRKEAYDGTAFANRLARRGFVVLIHDAFLWGSRRFPLDAMGLREKQLAECGKSAFIAQHYSDDVATYNATAEQHEHVVEKYCRLLGTTIAGVVAYEDRVALNFLKALPEVDEGRVGCIGLSGGGNRAALLTATHDSLSAAVIIGMMSTYEGLFDAHVSSHTWMFFPAELARHGDWPDLAACRAPRPLMVQYDSADSLFSLQGMQEADQKIRRHYESVGAAGNYIGQFYPGKHKFDVQMQEAAFAWLELTI